MALVGEAHIIVKAITTGVAGDIERGFKDTEKIASRQGKAASSGFTNAFNNAGGGNSIGSKFTSAFQKMDAEAQKTRQHFYDLQRSGYVAQVGLSGLLGSASALVGGLGALGGAAIGAAAGGLTTLLATIGTLGIGMIGAKLALAGVGQAVSALNKARSGSAGRANKRAQEDAERQLIKTKANNLQTLADAQKSVDRAQVSLNKALVDGAKALRDIGYAAEDAALSEKQAGLDLEKARMELARVQDLPPNSMARRQAELQYQQAELGLRKAKSATSDAQAEQKRVGGDINKIDGVMSANQALADAKLQQERDIVKALQAEQDAIRAVNRAHQDAGKSTVDALAGLTKSQRTFALFLASIHPQLQSLKEAVASGFLPTLQTQIERVVSNAFPMLRGGLHEVGLGLGEASKAFTDQFLKKANLNGLSTIFQNARPVIATFGDAAGHAFGSIITLMNIVSPMVKDFVNFIDSKVGAFDNFLKVDKNGQVTTFFKEAEGVLKRFGSVFGNVFKGIGGIVMANFGKGSGGDIMLTWLEKATAGFANIGKDGTLRTYFQEVAKNATSILHVIGDVLKVFLKLGASPEIRTFWTTIDQAVPSLQSILTEGIKVLPIFGELAVSVAKIIAAFSDSGTPQAFFSVLAGAAKMVADFFNQPLVQSILNTLGPIHGVVLALGSLFLIGGKIGAVLFATFSKFGALGPVVAIIAGIVIGLTALYNTNADVKKSIDGMFASFSQLLTTLAPMFDTMMKAIAPIFTTLVTDLSGTLTSIIPIIVDTVIPAIGELAKTFMEIVPVLLDGIIPAFDAILQAIIPLVPILIGALLPIISELLKTLAPLVPVILGALVPVITILGGALARLIPPIAQLITRIIDALMPAFTQIIAAVLPVVTTLAEALIPVIEAVIQALIPIIDIIVQVVGAFLSLVTPILSFVMPVITTLIAVFARLVTFILQILTPIFKGLSGILTGAFQGVVRFFKDVVINPLLGLWEGFINMFIDGINGVIGMLNKIHIDVPEWARGLFGGARTIGFSLAPIAKVRIPKLASGGVVQPSNGGTLATVAEAGRAERIEPLDASGLSQRDRAMITLLAGKQGGNAGNISITVHPAPGMDETALAAAVSRQLALQMRKGAIR